MKDTSAATVRLRQSNPVPGDAFGGAATDSLGQAAFERIITSAAAPSPDPDRSHRMRVRSATSGPGHPGRRLALRSAVPAIAVTAAAVTAWAAALPGASTPSRVTYTFDAFLSVHPQAHPGDAAAVLRRLAARAAAQPAQAPGFVLYSSYRLWEYVGDNTPSNLNYFSRHSYSYQAWLALNGASAVRIVRNFDGKVFTSSFPPATTVGMAEREDLNPANIPASPSAVRRWILTEFGGPATWSATYSQRVSGYSRSYSRTIQTGGYESRSALVTALHQAEGKAPGTITHIRIQKVGPFGSLTWQTVFVVDAYRFMGDEPLPPAVRSAMLLELARIAVHPGPGYTYVDMGTATDHLGRTGVVIGQEQANSGGPNAVGVQSLIFDPRTGALLDVANAQCDIAMGTIPRATGQCSPVDYTEFGLPRAVSAVPRYKSHDKTMVSISWGPWL